MGNATEKPTVTKMLETANEHDANAVAASVKLNQAMGLKPPTPGLPAKELKLDVDYEDPFGGNQNNRRVAKRIAMQKGRQYLNVHMPTHTGDPAKALDDIRRSEAMDPDVPLVGLDGLASEQLPQIELPTNLKPPPSPGSPAAKSAEAAAKTGQPQLVPPTTAATPPWKPQSDPVK